ncbi:site-specific recombinase, DNA invertase Pin homolog [Candidatus Scalindua japonica]|uniref:Site-specific recombinase, DNA invertase Pin homolog n=1 Tax=Candidatus Scalindua japonica TaxID=1284222 RepID=A0A286TYH4_9BACT|nr:recombinase family protein [Candidatus Scalindua japonica]GAX60916.1 site-specific recombinase, DNA invertase Pin homolog [Candidatus Scalindua japonica]
MESSLLYVRVSSLEQQDGYSLDAQQKLGYEYAQRKNLRISKMWKVSESAWREERMAFNQLIDFAKKHPEIRHIIFDVTDRMTRNDIDKLKVYDLIKSYDKTIHFSRSNKRFNKDSGSDDEFMFDIEVAVAKKMSNDISKKTKMGMLEKAGQGLFPSVAPIGYKNNRATRLIEIDEDKASYIKTAFSLMASGSYSLRMLEHQLYDDGLRNKHGNRVGKSSIHQTLKNPIYYGAFRWDGKMYQGSHTPIVTKQLFDKVQSVLSSSFHPSAHKLPFYFNNLMKCGICDCKVIGEVKKNKYKYYHCTFSKGRHKDVAYIREEKLAEMFVEPIQRITLNNDIVEWLKEGLRERSKNNLKLQENRYNSLLSQHDKTNKRLSRLYDAKFDGELDEGVFKAKEEEYKSQLIEIKSQIDNVQSINPNFYESGNKTLELFNKLYFQYVRANYEEKATILKFVASNYVLNDVSLYAVYRKPFDIIAEGVSCPTWLPGEDSNLQ